MQTLLSCWDFFQKQLLGLRWLNVLIGKLLTVDAIRSNNYKLMPRRVPKSEGNPQPTTTNNQVPAVPPGFTQVEADQDLPF